MFQLKDAQQRVLLPLGYPLHRTLSHQSTSEQHLAATYDVFVTENRQHGVRGTEIPFNALLSWCPAHSIRMLPLQGPIARQEPQCLPWVCNAVGLRC